MRSSLFCPKSKQCFGSQFGISKILKVVSLTFAMMLVVACLSACSNENKNDSESSSSDAATQDAGKSYVEPTNEYDIAGILGMNPADMGAWFSEHGFTTIPDGGNGLYRYVVNGTPMPGDSTPGDNFNTMSIQDYVLLSGAPEGSDLQNIFDSNSNEINPNDLASSNPRAALFVTYDIVKGSGTLPDTAESYLQELASNARLTTSFTSESGSKAYAIGICTIGEQQGIWIGFSEKDSSHCEGTLICGYTDDMQSSLGIDGATNAALEKISGISGSTTSSEDEKYSHYGSNSSSSTSSGSPEDEKYSHYGSNASPSASSTGTPSASGTTQGTSSSMAGSWRDPQYGDTMTLSSDGSGVITQDGQRFAGSWSESGSGITFTLSGGKVHTFVYSNSGGKEQLYESGTGLLFQR